MRREPITRPAVARPDGIRGRNLTSVLTLIHHEGPLSRADLTSRLGLGRSTIGALVGELDALGLIRVSVPTESSQTGRPSHVVVPHPDGPCVLAVDIAVEGTTIATVGIGGAIRRRWTSQDSTDPLTPRAVADRIGIVLELLGRQDPPVRPVGIGLSVPGTVDRHTGRIGVAPNLGWHDVDVRELLAHHVPVLLGNDADLAVLAEHIRGNGRRCDDLVFLIGRSGVGAGIIAGGLSLHGATGRAGEIGHNVIDPAGPPCHCGRRGCLETFVGQDALLAAAGLPASGNGGGDVDEVFERAGSGDRLAAAAVTQAATSLGEAIAVLANLLDPQRVLLGGIFDRLLADRRSDIERALQSRSLETLVVLDAPGLGADSALIGAAEIAFEHLLADPLGTRAAG